MFIFEKIFKMTLIKSISGIRGTLENIPGESLSDYDVKQFTLAYYSEIISNKLKVPRIFELIKLLGPSIDLST